MKPITINRKKIKHAYVRVRADGSVEISVPLRMSQQAIDELLEEKQAWIKKHQARFAQRPKREATKAKQYVSGEQFSVFGRLCTLQVEYYDMKKHTLVLQNNLLLMRVPHSSTSEQRESCLHQFYKQALLDKMPALLAKWQPIVGKQVLEYRVRNMKTRWGTCNIQKQRVWLSLLLAKYPEACLEYILVHEMTHLHERLHNQRFYNLMESFLPEWREREKLLRNTQIV